MDLVCLERRAAKAQVELLLVAALEPQQFVKRQDKLTL
jgi:hypothetical protein